MTSTLYSPLVVRALELAAMWHQGQFRKNPAEQVPYVVHPAYVGFLLQQAGFDDETIAAGMLHDVLEDCGVTREQIASATSPRVAELVSAVSELPKDVDWEERKAAYRVVLETAPIEALAIAAADHISNIRSIADMAQVNGEIWNVFHAKKAQRLVHEEAVYAIIESRLKNALVADLRHAIDLMHQLPD
ncbi:MAG: HD domain-containing protein [Patescibacteria group bacterium]